MAPISLPDFPKGKEFEEYVSAFFQSSGDYVERNIIERKIEEVLELDIITTDYRLTPPGIKLLEVKSGDWGFPDLFKVRGWMDYLNINNGIFVASKERENVDFLKQIAKSLHIDVALIPDLKKTKEVLSDFYNNEHVEHEDIACWRFSYWVERNLLDNLSQKKKNYPEKQCFKALQDYYFKVNSGIFFSPDFFDKIYTLYSAFKTYPHISAKCGNELAGNNFNDEYAALPKRVYEDTFFKCSYNEIQISTYIEHRSRLAILKNAIDYKLYEDTQPKDNAKETETILSPKDFFPKSFKDGLDSISKNKYFHKYPVFWQWFLWLFGGFILKDYKEREYALLSKKTGIPIDEIPNALDSYQTLFPQEDGWFLDLSPNSNIKVLKMFPVPFMGIGANYRRMLYTESGKFEDLKLSGYHTFNDLIKWNKLTINVLRK
jgi:hypothetical protein